MFSLASVKSTMATGVLLLIAVSAFAGDKIQFSKPSQPAQTAPAKDAPTKSSSGLFDSYRNAPSPLNFTPVTPQAVAPEKADKKEKDWIFARPEDGLTIEQALKIEDKSISKNDESNRSTKSLTSYIEQLQAADDAKRKAADLEAEANSYDPGFSVNKDGLDLSQPNAESNPRLQDNQSSLVTEYLKELRSPERERLDELNLSRRAEFEQIFQSRTVIPSSEGLAKNLNPLDAAREPANSAPTVVAPADLLGRTTQTSFSDAATGGFEPLTGTRTSVLEDVNSRALGRTSASALNTPTQTLRIQPQPAVLPFPSRPGSLFNRP
jgi:hypothetical protein